MAIWLFRRKSRRKRARNGDDAPQARLVNRSNTAPDEPIATPPRRNSSVKKNRKSSEPTKLQRRARTYSFDAGRRESLNVRKNDRENAPPVPPLPSAHVTGGPSAHNGGNIQTGGASHAIGETGYGQDAVGDIHRLPTLHATKSKRDGQHLGPRKSSKRRKNSHDREREAELKAMSNFVPHRPATDQWTKGRSMKRDTRRVTTGLGIGSLGASKEERSSAISLPESIHSTLSTDSDHVAFKVSAFSALSARPTLRYSLEPRWTPPGTSGAPLRGPSMRKRLSEKEPIPEATLRAHKRIDDLADDLDSGDLRELMERDQRRRDKKRQDERERVERRLQRRAERQRQAEASGSGTAPNMERGVLGRESVGLGIEPPSAVVTSSRSRESTSGKRRSPVDATADEVEDERLSRGPSPIRSFHRTSSVPPETPDEVIALEQETEKLATAASQSQSPTRRGLLRVKKTRTDSSTQGKSETAAETSRKGSESSSSRGPMSWTSIFRWGNKNRRSSQGPSSFVGPSSFSNTSRDSMATMPQPAAPANFMPSRRMSSGVPRRTLSRFREDLPDFPLSPPESRLQSPEAETMPPAIIEQDSPPVDTMADPMIDANTPTSQQYSSDVDHMRETPASGIAREELVASTEPQQSVSMASIDSESSWLAGRIGSRRSSHIGQQRSAANSRQSHHQLRTPTGSDEAGEADIAEETAGITDDEYLSRYARRPSAATWTNRKSVGDPQASSDEELERGDEVRWGSVGGGRIPTMVQSQSVKSREGLLNTFDRDDDESLDPDSPISPISIGSKDAEAGVQRARSVNLGRQHARQISAGSAKLLEISPRNSVDNKRRSAI